MEIGSCVGLAQGLRESAVIWSLQTLRFIAAFLIVYVHTAQTAFAVTGSTGFIPLGMVKAAHSGVDLFFVVSGVVIAITAPKMTAAEFMWRRLRRILPVYWFLCVPALLIAAKSGFGWREVLATILLWPATNVMTEPLIPVAWTLCFEMLFYVSAALVLLSRRLLYVLLAAYCVFLAFRNFSAVTQFLGNPIIIEFLLGVAIAQLPRFAPAKFGVLIGPALVVGAVAMGFAPDGGGITTLEGEDGFLRLAVYGLPAAITVFGAMQFEARQSIWTYLGGASYTIYLTHPFLVAILWVLWQKFPIPSNLIVVAGLAASILFAWRFYELVERPIMRLLPRTLSRTTPQHTDNLY